MRRFSDSFSANLQIRRRFCVRVGVGFWSGKLGQEQRRTLPPANADCALPQWAVGRLSQLHPSMLKQRLSQRCGHRWSSTTSPLAIPSTRGRGGHLYRFSQRHSRFFSLDGPDSYGLRGGYPYYKPRMGKVLFNVGDFEEIKNWCVAYHGSVEGNIIPIMLDGLRRPGEDGVVVAHG